MASKEPRKGDRHRQAQVIIRAPAGMKERLDEAAARQGITRNELVVRSMERTLASLHEDDELPSHREETCG